jgi:hypothetical protein
LSKRCNRAKSLCYAMIAAHCTELVEDVDLCADPSIERERLARKQDAEKEQRGKAKDSETEG